MDGQWKVVVAREQDESMLVPIVLVESSQQGLIVPIYCAAYTLLTISIIQVSTQ